MTRKFGQPDYMENNSDTNWMMEWNNKYSDLGTFTITFETSWKSDEEWGRKYIFDYSVNADHDSGIGCKW